MLPIITSAHQLPIWPTVSPNMGCKAGPGPRPASWKRLNTQAAKRPAQINCKNSFLTPSLGHSAITRTFAQEIVYFKFVVTTVYIPGIYPLHLGDCASGQTYIQRLPRKQIDAFLWGASFGCIGRFFICICMVKRFGAPTPKVLHNAFIGSGL